MERTAELLHVADLIADLVVTNGDERVVNLCRKALTGLPGRTDVALAEVLERVQSGLPGIARELGIELGKQVSIQEVLTYATASLVQINQGYETLILKLEDALQQKQDLTRLLERKNLELEALAATDPLTGAANRRRFTAVAQRTLKQHGEKGIAISILAFDLDHFKLVNDTHGHKAGDAVLVEVVRRLNLSLRPDDLVGRLGGEEFAVLLPGTDQEGARLAAERCRRRIADTPIDCAEVDLDITTSIGGSTHCGVVSLEAILHEADAALYAAKGGGRNQVVWYGETPK
jgi:diguanylate cyclase (GGDEF)-like protein